MFFDIEDLINESYFAMLDAVEYHDNEKGTFLTVLKFFLLKRFQTVSHLRQSESTHKYNWYHSMNMKAGSEDGEKELLEYMEDKAALQAITAVEDVDFCRYAREYINKALNTPRISKKERDYIKLVYFENVEPKQAMKLLHIESRQAAHNIKNHAFYIMRYGKYGMTLKKLLLAFEENEILPYYSRVERKAIQKVSKEKARERKQEEKKEWSDFEKWLLDIMQE